MSSASMPDPLRTINVVMPSDFPSETYNATDAAVTDAFTNEHPAWVEFEGGWRAVGYRFRGCARYSDSFTASVEAHGSAPPHEIRADQEDDLFGFFTSGLACLESFAYAMHALGSALDTSAFPMTTEREKKLVSIDLTSQRFDGRFGGRRAAGGPCAGCWTRPSTGSGAASVTYSRAARLRAAITASGSASPARSRQGRRE